MLKITYYHTLYKRDVTDIVCGGIEFKNGYVVFSSSGHKYAVGLVYVKAIEPLEN